MPSLGPASVVQSSIRSALLTKSSSHMKRSRACANLASLELAEAGPLVTKKSKRLEASLIPTDLRRQSLFLEAEFAFVPGFRDADAALAVWMEPCSLSETRIQKA
ncbi:hypothetical protein SPRG_15795 [Saprolegnia parasitica CBS 223.65]|uniref:Uncharacterized protein n=1 Tax=Saprolegnia parasitica (strain CBS 223.65) TaxID=695850 RepID=A0A067BL53_SAPPC|nr:hypothetical protein SPRG_15795 [Saprolegnia parasitica CBS 223.65]KDO18938.1 hypothetical protein SPRG_15795 [Saprolegnia parasitica CBS 223.65]|eukprot:XP_012210351.1 hypothetical protein SPRG_15795 [Saprolegnia parasitica CBS 223.65]